MTVNFSIWVAILRNGTVSGDFDLLKSKLGGYAPEWVAMLRNRTVPEGYFGGKIVILGGFAPEISTVSKPPKLGGHAPEHPATASMTYGKSYFPFLFTEFTAFRRHSKASRAVFASLMTGA